MKFEIHVCLQNVPKLLHIIIRMLYCDWYVISMVYCIQGLLPLFYVQYKHKPIIFYLSSVGAVCQRPTMALPKQYLELCLRGGIANDCRMSSLSISHSHSLSLCLSQWMQMHLVGPESKCNGRWYTVSGSSETNQLSIGLGLTETEQK